MDRRGTSQCLPSAVWRGARVDACRLTCACAVQTQAIYPIDAAPSPHGVPAYLDIVPTPEGYNHIALFSPANSSTPQFLTYGEWEVTSEILAVDVNRGLVCVYFLSCLKSVNFTSYTCMVQVLPGGEPVFHAAPHLLCPTSQSGERDPRPAEFADGRLQLWVL